MSAATGSVAESSSKARGTATSDRPTAARSPSVQSDSRHRNGTQGGGYTADYDNDDDEDGDGDFEGDDGDEDDEDQVGTEEGMGGKGLINETTIKSGYLWKRGEKRKNWKKRWFVLRSSKLCYYKNDKEYQLLRFIDLSDVHTVAAIALKKTENSFGIVTSKRQYYVRASSPKEMQQWIDALKDAREQVRQRSTMTQDLSAIELATSSGGENAPVATSRPRQASTSPNLMPIDRSQGTKAGSTSSPINIVIPGKGLYTAPAQARQSSTGPSTISPLTATSESDAGGPTGAEQFGLSYASSTGQSLASSPSRGIVHQLDYSSGGASGGRQSPHSHSGGDEGIERPKRSKTTKATSPGAREASVGSSGGEGPAGMTTGWTAAGERLQRQSSGQQQAPVLSSSDEDGEGEEWDEDEVADRAMPLPGSTGLTTAHSSHAPNWSESAPAAAAPSGGKPKVESEFFKDPNKVIHQGYLMKQSSRRKQWRKRWFILTSAHLSYTRSHMNGKPNRQIPLTSILDAIEYTSKKTQAPVSQTHQPIPSSPGPQSPNAGVSSFSFQLGASHEGGATGSSVMQRVEGTTNGESGSVPLGEVMPERRASVISTTQQQQQQPAHLLAAKRKKENCFKIITPKRTYVVCAPTEEEEIKWLSALQALLAHWRGAKGAETEAVGATSQQPPMPKTPARRGSTADDVNVLVQSPSPP